MFIRGGGQTDRHRYITRATLAYALFALLWIVVPDQCLSLFTNSSQVQWFATTKDTAFLAISSLLLYLALKHLPAPGFSRLAPEHLVAGQETLQLWPRWASYAFALLVSLSILLVRLSLPEQEQLRPLMTLFVLPIVLSAALGGWGPGILATALAALGVSYYFTAPLHSLLINNRQDQLQLVFLIANGIIVSLLCEYMLRSRGRLKTIQELQAVTLASAGDAIISTDRAGRVVTFNPAAERLTGWSHDQAVGLPLERVFSIDRPAAEGAADIPLSQLLATGAMAPVSREALLHRHNGSDRSIDITAAPIRSSDQAARGVILTCRDVTDRRQAMDILSQSEARYARVIEGSNQGFWEWNLQTDEFSTSAQFDAMLGYAAGETNMPTNQLAKFVHPDDLGQLRASVAAHIQGLSDTHQTELRCLTKGGEWMWILTRGKIVERDQEGRPRLMAGTHTDISARKQTEVALQQAATVFESTREGILIVDASRRIIKINRAFTQLTGYSEAESIGQLALLLNSSRNSDEYRAAIWKKIENSGYWQGELWFRRKNGEIFPVIASINAAKDTAGILANYVSVFMDISTLKASEEQLHFLAHHDALTKLPNRRLLLSQLEHALARLGRDGGTLGLLMFDLDRFKDVNDSFGHAVGDQLLMQVASRLTDRLRNCDTVARLGGDEFTVLLENISVAEDAARVAKEVIVALSPPFHLPNGMDIRSGASIGISLASAPGNTAENLLQQADTAMYRAKAEGRGHFQYFSESMTVDARQRIDLDSRLRRALEREEFSVHYQPQIDIITGRLVGAEALVRWMDPEEGLVAPGRFIAVAEETGLIKDIGEWVLRETCRQGKAWLDAGRAPIVLAVNISAHQIRYADLVGSVDRILSETCFAPTSLELEVTESSLMDDTDEVSGILSELRKRKIRLAIDDFGTGYSSLSYLKRFTFDVLKIDKSFIDDISHDQDDRTIIQAIIDMGHTLGIKVLAEGVESAEQLTFLRAHQCDLYQGYFKSRPIPAEAFSEFLK